MKVIVNGEETSIACMSVIDYLQMLGIDPQRLAIELNKEILAKINYETTMLRDGDQIEIIWFVGGG